ncbi:Hypothetical protein UVM_LOCUS309 [uncultured virus]|nr:Hypothetical protein UVM_LOCUS309 [uncultured virus]
MTDRWATLDRAVLESAFALLDCTSAAAAAAVCKHWRRVLNVPLVPGGFMVASCLRCPHVVSVPGVVRSWRRLPSFLRDALLRMGPLNVGALLLWPNELGWTMDVTLPIGARYKLSVVVHPSALERVTAPHIPEWLERLEPVPKVRATGTWALRLSRMSADELQERVVVRVCACDNGGPPPLSSSSCENEHGRCYFLNARCYFANASTVDD